MPKRRKHKTVPGVAAWTDLVSTGLATATTLAVRVPQLMRGTMTPAESHRMVAEKVMAATEGAMAGSAVMARILSKRVRKFAPHEALNDIMAIADAMARPARRRVKSNAMRLTKV